jgi:Na+/H+ antiporter NhaD/arsenite permease-like protein
VLGYAGIIFEEFFAFNKAGVALLTAVGMWTVRAAGAPSEAALNASLGECLADVSQIVFFLIGAMTVVETVDAHAGFKLVTDAIDTRDKKALLWLVGGLTFCMSAILDNLTSTIVMVSLLRKLVKDPEQRNARFVEGEELLEDDARVAQHKDARQRKGLQVVAIG